ncbi:MAG: hypothetical protein ACU843_11630 [Gammaproteobacteria bacterium]
MRRLFFLSALLIVAGTGTLVAAEEQWNPSILSEGTIAEIQKQNLVYQKCLGQQVAAFHESDFDSREASNRVLKKCENELDPIRNALLKEKVPLEIANRYLLRKRHQAAREVLKYMMFAESQQKAQ